MGACEWLGGIVAVDVGLGTLATAVGGTGGTAAAVGETGGTAAVVEEAGATVAAGGVMGEGDGSASQAKAAMVENMHNSVSRNGNRMIYEKVVAGI